MPRSEALKEAQKRYRARIKGTEVGDRIYERIKVYNREAFKKKYTEDEGFRMAKNEYCRLRAYYKEYETGTLRAIRGLFGDNQFYGR
jgi:hypothetical protein